MNASNPEITCCQTQFGLWKNLWLVFNALFQSHSKICDRPFSENSSELKTKSYIINGWQVQWHVQISEWRKTKNKNKKNVIPVLKIFNDVRTISTDRTSFSLSTFEQMKFYLFITLIIVRSININLHKYSGTDFPFLLIGISIGIAFMVILMTTLNILLSFYSIITIFFILSVTIGILVLTGWELNIMESIVFSVAAGLSADFTLHYSVAYRTSLLRNNRVERTKSALSHIGAPILMGAFTTFIAGKF